MTPDVLEQAQAHFDAGEFRRAREVALEALGGQPEDVGLLRVAGRSGVELDEDDAVDHLRKVVELRPDDADGWSDLGEALAAEGRDDEASEAFRRALEIRPDDPAALTHLGHTAYASGQGEEGISYLSKAAENEPGASSAAISLVEMYKAVGQPEQALEAAQKVAEAQPDDVLAALDVAELSLELGRHDEARSAFERIRQIDELADHEVYALHGMIQVELQREGWDRARELAEEAAGVDQHGRTSDLVAFLDEQRGQGGEEPAPSRAEVDEALATSQAEHRRLHADDRHLLGDDVA